jgi:cytochrome c oxidase subunit 4
MHARTEVRTYGVIFAVLLLLVAVTVETARHDLGRWNFVVSVLIAAVKAALIALYFMEVRRSAALVKLVIAAGLLWLAILFSLSLADYWTRHSVAGTLHGEAVNFCSVDYSLQDMLGRGD